MLTEVPATPERIGYVLRNLWVRGEKELILNGLSKKDAFQTFCEYTKGHYAGCLVDEEGVPVLVAGIVDDHGESYTWFLATERFNDFASEVTRYVRRVIQRHKTDPVRIYSVCVHPDTEKWFRVLGCDKDEDFALSLPSGATLYRFKRR